MTIKDLKNNLNKVDDSFKIFLSAENNFLAFQYINEISKNKKLNINFVDSLDEINSSTMSLIMEFSPQLNVCLVDEFNEIVDGIDKYKNCIVVCNKINKNIEPSVKDFIIEFPKLEDWQIKDYMNTTCPGLTSEEIDWLYTVTGGNIYRIINELSKVNIFEKENRRRILNELKNDSESDLFFFDNYFLNNSLMSKNILNILNFLSYDKCKSVNPLLLVGSILSECKKILFIKFNSGLTASQLGISEGKKNYILNNYFYLSEMKLKEIIEFLMNIEYSIKSGLIEGSDQMISEYIICNLINML